jgi:hypothetical protein
LQPEGYGLALFKVLAASPVVLVFVKVKETCPDPSVVPVMKPASEPLEVETAAYEVPPLDHVAFEPL